MKPRFLNTKRRRPARKAALTSAILFGMAGPVMAVDNLWTGDTTDWNTVSNWSLGRLPAKVNGQPAPDDFDDAVINTTTPNPATITVDLAVTPRDIVVGSGEGADGAVHHRAGIAATGDGNWMFVGRLGGTGGYHLADTGTIGTGVTGFGPGTGSLHANGRLYIGGWASAGSAVLNVNTTGTLAIATQLQVGNGSGTGVMNLEQGTVTTGTEWVEFGNGAGSHGTLNMSGGTFTKGGNNHFSIGTNGGTGTGTITGGSLTVNNEIWLGQATGSLGNLSFSGGTIANNSYVAIGREGGTGNLNMSGGTWTKTGGGIFIVGASGPGSMSQSGGLVDVQAGDTVIGELNGGSGSFTLTDTAEFRANYFQVARNAGSTGTANLQGGTLRVAQIAGGGGAEHVYFDGTQLIATANQANFIAGIDAGQAVINFGGLKINSNGFNLGVPQALTGFGGVVKSGLGTVALGGANSYEGETVVSEGKLVLTTASTLFGDGSVADGASLGVTQTAAAASLTVPNLTLGTAGATTLDFDLGNFAGNPTASPVTVSGALTLNGTVTINITDALPDVGSIPLVSYAMPRMGAGSFVLGSLPLGTVGTLSDNGTGQVSLNLTQVTLLEWKGVSGSSSAAWDIGVTNNWKNLLNGATTTYVNPGAVLFNDNGLSSRVNITGSVAPGKVTINNSAVGTVGTYRLQGSGKITGPATLLKQGAGNLMIFNTTPNDYTGPTILEGGVTSATSLANGGSASSIGASSASPANLVLGGGVLSCVAAAATTTDRGFTISGANSGISALNDLTMGGQVVSTGGNFTKTGAGKLTLTYPGANVFGTASPGLQVKQSTVALTGGGTQTNTVGGECWVGSTPTYGASLALTGTSLAVQSWLIVGRGNGNSGLVSSLTATDSTISTGNFTTGYIGEQTLNNCVQTLTLTNTVWTNSGLAQLAESAGSTTTMTVGGTSAFTSAGIMFIGMGSGAQGTLNLTGGSFTGSSWIAIGRYTGGSGNAIGHVNVSGGVFNQTNPDNALIVGEAGTGNLTVSGTGAVVSSGTLLVSNGTTGIGTVNLNGGTLTARQITAGLSGAGTGNFNFNGGTLRVGAGAAPVFMSLLDTVTVKAGGAVIDTNGQTVSINQSLQDGGGGLTKSGAGTLYLNGFHGYTGMTQVTAGTLAGTGDFSGPITVATGADLNPGAPGGTLYGTAVTFANGSTLTVDMAQTEDTLQAEALDITGAALVLNGTPTLPIYVLARYTSLTGNFASVPALPAGYTLNYDYTGNGGHEIALTREADGYETWAQTRITAINPAADATRGGDPDADGRNNLAEFALDGDPLSGAADGKMLGKIANVQGTPTLVLTLPVRTGATFSGATEQTSAPIDGVIYKIQGTDDLTTWNLAVGEVTGQDKLDIESDPKLLPLNAGWTYRTFRSPGTVTGDPADYLRVVILSP